MSYAEDCRYRAVLTSRTGGRTTRPPLFPTAKQAAICIDHARRGTSRWADGWVEERGPDGRWRLLSKKLAT